MTEQRDETVEEEKGMKEDEGRMKKEKERGSETQSEREIRGFARKKAKKRRKVSESGSTLPAKRPSDSHARTCTL